MYWLWASTLSSSNYYGGSRVKETDAKLLAMLLMNTIYTDIRSIIREELERVGFEAKK